MEFLQILGILFERHSSVTTSLCYCQLKLLSECHFITYTTNVPFGLTRPLHFQFALINPIVSEKITKENPGQYSGDVSV